MKSITVLVALIALSIVSGLAELFLSALWQAVSPVVFVIAIGFIASGLAKMFANGDRDLRSMGDDNLSNHFA